MGPLLAIFLVISLNMVPEDVDSLTLDNYVVEGVGIHTEPTRFHLSRTEDARWLMLDAQGAPWFVVDVEGPVLSLTTNDGAADQVDIGAALGLPADAWWASEALEPPGLAPILLAHQPDGLNVTLDGMRAAEVRW